MYFLISSGGGYRNVPSARLVTRSFGTFLSSISNMPTMCLAAAARTNDYDSSAGKPDSSGGPSGLIIVLMM